MYILPAIDLKDGKVVRLYKGDFNTVHQVAQDPLETARAFSEAGARWIHMVDLDGAKEGKPVKSFFSPESRGNGKMIRHEKVRKMSNP